MIIQKKIPVYLYVRDYGRRGDLFDENNVEVEA